MQRNDTLSMIEMAITENRCLKCMRRHGLNEQYFAVFAHGAGEFEPHMWFVGALIQTARAIPFTTQISKKLNQLNAMLNCHTEINVLAIHRW